MTRVGVNSIPELELQVNSNSNSGIGIEIGGIENGIVIENPGIGIGMNWKPELNFLQLLPQHLLVNQPFPNFSFNHVNRGGHDLSCDWLFMQQGMFLGHCSLWYGHKRHMKRVPCSPWVDKGQKN